MVGKAPEPYLGAMRTRVPVAALALAPLLSAAACRGTVGRRTIAEIQGAGHSSPYVGTDAETSGIVTAVERNGFWMQDPVGDGSPATSEGLLVFTGDPPSPSVGDEVTVRGTITEFRPDTRASDLTVTEIIRPTVSVLSRGNPLPAAIEIGVDRTPPVVTVDDDGFASFDPATDGIDFYESLEGMRVTVPHPTAVGPISRRGEVFVVAGDRHRATGRHAAGGITVTVGEGGVDYNPERIKIQPAPTDSGAGPTVNTGDALSDVTGVLSYGFGNFAIRATTPLQVTSPGPDPEVTTLPSGGSVLTVATFNVENLDPNDDGDRDVAEGRFTRLASQIAVNLRAPDIVALQEIQDDDGSVDSDVTTAGRTLTLLADAINERLGADVYKFIDNVFIGDDTNGGQPGANIRVAFLYRSDRVSVVPGSERTVVDTTAQRTDPDNPFYNCRPPLAVVFLFGDAVVTVINNHFSSKQGGTPVFGSVQPFVNGSATERSRQALEVNAFVDGLLAMDRDARVIVLGDFNEFWFDSIISEQLAGAGDEHVLDNLWLELPGTERYSYIFEGNGQTLDNFLVTPNLKARLLGFDAVHVNSLFADQASDHDPLIAAFEFAAAEVARPDVASPSASRHSGLALPAHPLTATEVCSPER